MTQYRGALAPPGDSVPRPAMLEIVHEAIDAELRDGRRFHVPFARASLELGGDDGRTLFVRPPDRNTTVVCNDPEFVAALRAASFGVLDDEFAKIEVARKARRRTRGLVHLALAAVVGVVGAAAWWIPTHGVARVVRSLPISVDRSLGDRALDAMNPEPVVHRPVLDQALDEIVSRLAAHAAMPGFDFRLRVVDRADMNSFALPGGAIVVFTGLVRRATRADQVAGVLAHEMAHVTLRHGTQGLVRAAGVSVAWRVLRGESSALLGTVTAGAMTTVLNGYSRGQESAADAEGVRMVAAAGMDPRGLVEFIRMPLGAPGSKYAGETERITMLDERIPRLHRAPARPLSVDWASVRAAAGL